MTNLEAAIQVLKEAGGPLHCRQITKRALERGFIEPHGKTPAATMAAAFYGHVKQAPGKDEPPMVNGVGGDLVESGLRTALYSTGLIACDGEQIRLAESGDSLRKSRDRSELLGYSTASGSSGRRRTRWASASMAHDLRRCRESLQGRAGARTRGD